MVDTGAGRFGPLLAKTRPRGWAQLSPVRPRAGGTDLYASDHADSRRGGRFRWLISTCLAAAVGAVAILVVIYGSTDPDATPDGLLPALKRMSEGATAPAVDPLKRRQEGLRWQVPRADRLQVTSGAMSTRHTIHEMLRQRVAGRDKIYAKRYVRIHGRLTPVPSNYSDVIPPFNPLKLFGNTTPVGSGDTDTENTSQRTDVSVKVVELLGGILPEEDGQELAASEVEELVERAEGSTPATAQGGQVAGAGSALADGMPSPANLEAAQYTTVLAKSTFDSDDAESGEAETGTVKTVTVGAGETLTRILVAAGAEKWQATTMVEATDKVFPATSLTAGQQIEITLVPSLTVQGKMEPVRFSIFAVMDGAREHKVTVTRNAAGEFVASAEPSALPDDLRPALGEGDQPQTATASLYASLYYASLIQRVPPDVIMQNLRIHAYDTDFRRRIRAGDQIELFFDPEEGATTDGPPGELLFTAITAGGETNRYYRFRTPDGVVDFYDADGNNSKKFLMRRPVRGQDIRLTSGYGMRFHPLLNERKMHTGVDWSADPGTPILAAGNGTIEEAGRKGHYGNYVRIRHANGYQSAYAHMSRFAPGVEAGAKVRQGQVIGHVGSTGLSSGPHLHYEVLVNTRFVDPMSIDPGRERQLKDRDLEAFHKERARIDDLMRRAPVKTEMLAGR